MLSGMANFFGKKGLGTSILRGAQRLNPIDLAHGEAARAWQHIVHGNVKPVGLHYDQARKVYRGTAPKWSGFSRFKAAAKGYFAGDNLSDVAANMGMTGLNRTPAEVRRRSMLARRAVGATVGASIVGGAVMGEGNPLSAVSGAALEFGAAGTVMGLIGQKSPAAGAAFGAWTGLNMMRSGNQLGPF